jgi:hypothetical protein
VGRAVSDALAAAHAATGTLNIVAANLKRLVAT